MAKASACAALTYSCPAGVSLEFSNPKKLSAALLSALDFQQRSPTEPPALLACLHPCMHGPHCSLSPQSPADAHLYIPLPKTTSRVPPQNCMPWFCICAIVQEWAYMCHTYVAQCCLAHMQATHHCN